MRAVMTRMIRPYDATVPHACIGGTRLVSPDLSPARAWKRPARRCVVLGFTSHPHVSRDRSTSPPMGTRSPRMPPVVRRSYGFAFALGALTAFTQPASAQIPEKFENLQYFPKDIPRDTLVNVMRGFSFALGVRCQFCHAGGDGVSFQGVNFASDDKVTKRNARFMLRMVDSL